MREVDFPIEREPADAWPDFVGWRVNYEQAAYAVASAVDAVPALWSGPRRHHAAHPAHPPGAWATARVGEQRARGDSGSQFTSFIRRERDTDDSPSSGRQARGRRWQERRSRLR